MTAENKFVDVNEEQGPNSSLTIEPEIKRRAPVNFTITHGLPGGRQITAQTSYFPHEGENPNALIEEVSTSLDRQRARYEIGIFPGEEDTLNTMIATHEEKIAQADADIVRLDKECDEKIAALKMKHLQASEGYNRRYSELQGEADKDERGRVFDPEKPGGKRELRPFVQQQVDAEAEIEKLEKERAAGKQAHASNMAMFQLNLDKFKSKRDARLKYLSE